jgi:hypothetical protein
MTLTNYASDGHYPELIALFRAAAARGSLDKDELVRVCTVGDDKHLRATLSTWVDLGLFTQEGSLVGLAEGVAKRRGETLDEFTDRLPGICRRRIFDSRHALPLWRPDGEITDEGIGPSADFVRELAWTLSQDIYSFDFDAVEETAAALESQQVIPPKYIFKNRSRWSGLCFWARYTGFASGDGRSIDPTDAIRAELPDIFQGASVLPALAFLRELGKRVPVLDFGTYRSEVESVLKDSVWRRPPRGQLSTSLSFALRRLHLDQTIGLEAPADAGETFLLSGREFRPWHPFSQVELRSLQS